VFMRVASIASTSMRVASSLRWRKRAGPLLLLAGSGHRAEEGGPSVDAQPRRRIPARVVDARGDEIDGVGGVVHEVDRVRDQRIKLIAHAFREFVRALDRRVRRGKDVG